MWKEKLCSIILLLSLFLVGCQKEKENKMSTLKINFQEGDLPTLHPHDLMIYLRGISIAKCLFEGLTRIDKQGKAELAGAASIDASSDGLRYTITLRENHFSDGAPVTASHYEKAWKTALSPVSSCSRANLLYVFKNAEEAKRGIVSLDEVGIKASDDKTLIVDLAYPSPHFLELLTHPIFYPIRSPEKKEITVFNGPFKVDRWERGLLLRLKPNPYHWNRNNVSLKQIDVSMMQDMATVFTAYENKAIDWIGVPLCNLTVEQISQLKQENSLRSHPVDRAFWVFLNTENPAFSSPLIRQALSLAIDRHKITQHILVGGQPLSKPFPDTLLPSIPAKQIDENLSLAKQLFDQGLKELNLTKQSFPPISISFAQQANRKQLAEYLREAWSDAFGIDVQLDSQEWNVLRANIDKGLFEITGCFEAAFYKDPLEVMERFISRNSGNFSQWINSSFSQAISSAKREKNPEQRTELMAQAEQILIDEMPFIPICSDKLLFAHNSALKDYAFDYVGAIDFSYARLQN